MYFFHPRGLLCDDLTPRVFLFHNSKVIRAHLFHFKLLRMAEANPTQNKHGGSRSVLTWEQKLSQIQPEIVCEFVANTTCNCGKIVWQKWDHWVKEALRMVANLGEERLAGLWLSPPLQLPSTPFVSKYPPVHTTGQNLHVTLTDLSLDPSHPGVIS